MDNEIKIKKFDAIDTSVSPHPTTWVWVFRANFQMHKERLNETEGGTVHLATAPSF